MEASKPAQIMAEPPAVAIGTEHSHDCSGDGDVVGLGIRLGVYAICLGYLALIRRLRKNESPFTIMARIVQCGNAAAAVSAIILVTILLEVRRCARQRCSRPLPALLFAPGHLRPHRHTHGQLAALL